MHIFCMLCVLVTGQRISIFPNFHFSTVVTSDAIDRNNLQLNKKVQFTEVLQ